MPVSKKSRPAKCFKCKEPVDPDDAYCYGCEKHVCEQCDVNVNLPFGGHLPEDHLQECIDDL